MTVTETGRKRGKFEMRLGMTGQDQFALRAFEKLDTEIAERVVTREEIMQEAYGDIPSMIDKTRYVRLSAAIKSLRALRYIEPFERRCGCCQSVISGDRITAAGRDMLRQLATGE